MTVGGALVIALSVLAPWLRAHAGGRGDTFTGIDMLWLAIPLWIVCLVIAGSVFASRPDIRSGLGMVGAAVIASICALLAATAEFVAAIVPVSLIPHMFREYVVDIGAGAGLWVAFIASLFVFVAASRYDWKQPLRMLMARTDHIGAPQARRALIVTVVSVLVLCWLRYQPWLNGAIADEPVDVAGWDTPVTGPVTFVAIGLFVLAGILSFTSRIRAATVCVALGGWTFTFLAGMVILSGAAWSLLPLDDYTVGELADKLRIGIPPGAVADSTVELGAAWGTWASYVFGLTAAISAIWVLRYEVPEKATGEVPADAR